METFNTGMQNLRIAQFFLSNQEPTEKDKERLRSGLRFIDRILATVTFLAEDEVDRLDESTLRLNEARMVDHSFRRLNQAAATFPEVEKFCKQMRVALLGVIENRESPEHERQLLKQFFGTVGEAMMSEVIDRVPEEHDQEPRELTMRGAAQAASW